MVDLMLDWIPHRWARAVIIGGSSLGFLLAVSAVALGFSAAVFTAGVVVQIIVFIFWIFYGLVVAKFNAFIASALSLLVAGFFLGVAAIELLVFGYFASINQTLAFKTDVRWLLEVGMLLDFIGILIFLRPLAAVYKEYREGRP
jgi:hypothetical protein